MAETCDTVHRVSPLRLVLAIRDWSCEDIYRYADALYITLHMFLKILMCLWVYTPGAYITTISKWVEVDGLSTKHMKAQGLHWCNLCSRHKCKLKVLCNFTALFVNRISGKALQKDDVLKHAKSEIPE